MSENVFLKGVALATNPRQVQGRDYLPKAEAVSLATQLGGAVPEMELILSPSGDPVHFMLGGGLIRVRVTQGDLTADAHLPILNAANGVIPFEKIASKDVVDHIARAFVKGVALSTGVGLSLYAGLGGDGAALAKAVSGDLRRAAPLLKDKGVGRNAKPYVPWAVSYAAAKAADAQAALVVRKFDIANEETGEVTQVPYLVTPRGLLVQAGVRIHGREFVETLAIEDQSPAGWNKAVWRCFAKAVAFATGYALSVYGAEELGDEPGEPQEQEGQVEMDEPKALTKAELLTQLSALIPADKVEIVLKAAHKRGLVEAVPDSLKALVQTSPQAAGKILASYQR